MAPEMKEVSHDAIMYLIHHIFLPPKLPQEDDFNLNHENVLLGTVYQALNDFRDCVTHDQDGIVDSVIAMITNLKTVRECSSSDGSVSEERLEKALENICSNGGMVPLHIRAQNAGVLISKVDNSVNFELFELSPLNLSVMTTKGRLRRSFPGPAFSLSIDKFQAPGFQATVSRTLAKMSFQPAAETMPKVKKARQMHDETRDTVHPKIVTELFTGILRSVGQPVDVSRVWKNTREEVLWRDALLPWRRSPLWLFVRVAMQLVFSRETKVASGPLVNLYKEFMVFLMSRVLKSSLRHSLHSDLLYIQVAKISRRLLKIDSPIQESTSHFVTKAMQKARNEIQKTWSSLVKNSGPRYDLSRLGCLDFNQDTFHSLPALDEYIKLLSERENTKNFGTFHPSSILAKYSADELPNCPNTLPEEYSPFSLTVIEDWVVSNLPEWLQRHKSNTSTCGRLSDLIQKYHAIAAPVYSKNPEASSAMLLIILELWVACDESAVHICNLLLDYDPGIPQGILQSLVLPFKDEMERLLRVENYICSRQARARFSAPSIFSDFGLEHSFAIRYFNLYPELQKTLEEIERWATQERQTKREELQRKKEEYNSLMQRYNETECDYHEVIVDYHNDFRQQQHSPGCIRCSYQKRADSLTISIHEWPLPRDVLQARSTVFELKVPPFFGHWRDITIFLLLDVLKTEYSSKSEPRSHHPLRDYAGLSSFFTSFSAAQRVGLLSETKPHIVTHRRSKRISVATEREVCLENGMHLRYFDNISGLFIVRLSVGEKISETLTYILPAQSLALQKFLYRPFTMPNGLPPNTVIANQSDCPFHMSLDEYKALCTIPLGCRIQWQNILLQLSAPSIDFKKIETGLVILQSIYQAGPSNHSNVLRVGHEIADDDTFANALLASLFDALRRVRENWEASQALSTFMSLARRLLTLTSTQQVREQCMVYLASTRVTALNWLTSLKDNAHRITDNSHRADLASKAVEIALICIDSFNVDQEYLSYLFSEPKTISDFLQCSIVIQQGSNCLRKASDPAIPLLYQRRQWLSYRCYPILARQILADGWPLDDAITRSWSAYRPGEAWRVVSEELDYCLVSKTAPEGNANSLPIHFNLLTGELLVNGHPLSRLPAKYERHPTYRTLFGNSALEVMPTAVQGMQFSGKKQFADYTLHFGLSDHIPDTPSSQKYDILIQAVKDDRKYELIPSRILRGMFPEDFVEKFVQWYDMTDGCLEFRSIEGPWVSSLNNWRLMRFGSRWRLTRNGTSLVSICSDTSTEISGMLVPLEDSSRIHIIFDDTLSSVEVELPRLQLGFYLRSGDSFLKSRQFRGMAVDRDQSLGTLIGLYNKLVLQHEDGSRHFILPAGVVSCVKKESHVSVTIEKDSAAKAHLYSINSQICGLIDNGSLQSKLFLCYLHALTSFCLPDPLICSTGTEKALCILRSAAVRSFDQLTEENVRILEQIAQLTPRRRYYPADKCVMQSVEWSPTLGFMAQHGEFHRSVTSIFEQADRMRIFQPDFKLQRLIPDGVDSHLLERDSIRSSSFRGPSFGAEDHTVAHDVKYKPRDQDQNSERGCRAFIISNIVYHRRTSLHYAGATGLRTRLWQFLSMVSEIFGPNHLLPYSRLVYDSEFLLQSSEFISQHWCAIHRTFSHVFATADKFRVMIWLSTLAFAKDADMRIIQVLALFFTVAEMGRISAPRVHSFNLQEGVEVSYSGLRDAFQSSFFPMHRCPEANLARHFDESKRAFTERKRTAFQNNQNCVQNRFYHALVSQWPCEAPSAPVDDADPAFHRYLNIPNFIKEGKPKFKIWFDNHCFKEYIYEIETITSRQLVDPVDTTLVYFDIPTQNISRKCGFISDDDIFSCPAPILARHHLDDMTELLSRSANVKQTTSRLGALITQLDARTIFSYERNFVEDLRESLRSLQQDFGTSNHCLQTGGNNLKEILFQHRRHCQEHVDKTYSALISAAAPEHMIRHSLSSQKCAKTTASIEQRPRLSPTFFLQGLARNRWQKLRNDWKRSIVYYGVALTELQRAERLVSLSENHADLIKELLNSGHTNWDPFQYPESLLLEVESGIMIREVQEQIAAQMRDPTSNKNAVMQLNMGEGKSSVIVPIVAAALADGSRLVRVIVAKPQSKQMFQMLVSKLGGLLDRRVYHMPFSRALQIGKQEAKTIGDLYRECMSKGGILLVQPEHILSFELMGLECLISGKASVGRSLIKTQRFFDASSRDIVDESDENFSVKFELIYTMGMQRPVEHSPDRWIHIHKVLDIVREFSTSVAKDFPRSMEVHERWPGGFPRTRILRHDAQRHMFDLVARQICKTGLSGFPIARQPGEVRQAVFKYITEPELTQDEVCQVENQGSGGFWTDTTRNTLLLLRGLIAGGVLPFAFGQKRWRVNYGLDATRQPRTKLAVPYRAKDNPTPRSEFSHPDVVIILTSLSCYYGGLEDEDLFVSFAHLLKSDQADIQYQVWVRDAPDLPLDFRQLMGINLKNRLQCLEQIFPFIRYAKSVIDYFLGHIVFPKEMKEFPHKLSASGWDIGKIKTHPTTGFSGTNDSRKTLPLSVEHLDLPEQKHTNALVLEYLLRPENSVALMQPRAEASSTDAELLLAMVVNMEPKVQVILDVGAQILELGNLGVAREWLRMVPDKEKKQAVVFFDDCDEISVLDRRGHIEPLQTSSYAKRLDLCLLFLDEAHTRGTDLKLPDYYRAAVTLGANLTKDRLVQACMRMRRLGKGQSVVFCIPEEIKTKMLAHTKPANGPIDVSDVLSWAVSETCIDMRRSIPLWAIQGQRYEHHRSLWAEAHTKGKIKMSKAQAVRFLEEESQTLDARYRPTPKASGASAGPVSNGRNLDLIMERCREFDSVDLNSATLQEEQERELSPENEQERQIQRPPPATAAEHRIHRDIEKFVSTGRLIEKSKAYTPAFETLRDTSAAKHIDVSQFPTGLLVSADFASTVQISGGKYISDAYQRPVQWILTNITGSSTNADKRLIIISPYEAQELLPVVKQSKVTTLHLYTPRVNMGFRTLDGLDLYTIPNRPLTLNLPHHLVLHLNLFSGQLYFSSFKEYVEVCELLSLAWEENRNGRAVAADGFMLKCDSKSTFTDSPVKFLKVFMTKIRRNCEEIEKTHVGTMLNGDLLRPADFEKSEND
ncbi:hypothetical protein EMPG_15752 [Blastomyces silverae]|uniref:ubiquitinyl hydrolase 1 n=1 Tax=Blastomyces silverae TaxID=2060906 RepID=A0A0H1BCK2_9EURO|nr:hypothetical protein EMPG_15752 [Blastomyces silverae]